MDEPHKSVDHPGPVDEGGLCRDVRADVRRNRARILAAAWRVLGERGADGLTMEEVAHCAGVGKGTLYRHYATKTCLVRAVLTDGAEELAQVMDKGLSLNATATTQLRQLIHIVYDVYERRQISIDMLLAMIALSAEMPVPESLVGVILERVRRVIEQGAREGLFRSLDHEYAAVVLFATISPIAFYKQRAMLGYSSVQLEEKAFDWLLHALSRDADRA